MSECSNCHEEPCVCCEFCLTPAQRIHTCDRCQARFCDACGSVFDDTYALCCNCNNYDANLDPALREQSREYEIGW